MEPSRIAIVGIGLRYPEASDPDQLWEGVLAGRRAFRTIPNGRMNLDDYYDPDPTAPDKFYSTKAAVLRDFAFDRAAWKIPASTYQATDHTHWLALDTCGRALADAGFADGQDLPKARTGVILGNTLTGEFSRASLMRLRWPYVRRTVAATLANRDWSEADIADVLEDLEETYKAPFAPVGEDSLAGGLANTIAGRICNYFDLGGGGFTIDGACSSSLLATVDACNALMGGDLDVALCGGVDLSIDPFEVVGFAKTGALSTDRMKVYDRDSNGFWPGEGCGVVVLMREQDALEQGRHVYATITGWGVSSDGKGGITRPEVEGHRRAIERAYARSGYSTASVSYFEGHGTGTAVGDATEIAAIATARPDDSYGPAALGSVKANIGHTKAAAGAAGLIKATLALHHGLIPPSTGQFVDHPALAEHADTIYVPHELHAFPANRPARAGVSSMGFGGINVHIALENAEAPRGDLVPRAMRDRVRGRQDAELIVVHDRTLDGLANQLRVTAEAVTHLSEGEVTDFAISTQEGSDAAHEHRVAVVVTTPDDAASVLAQAAAALETAPPTGPRPGRLSNRAYYGNARSASIAFAFPGQAAGTGVGAALARRFELDTPERPLDENLTRTDLAQPRILAATLSALEVLDDLDIHADVCVGHSLGELAALSWAGCLDAAEAVRLAGARGEAMHTHIPPGGAMAALLTDRPTAQSLIEGSSVEVAATNAPLTTIVAGPGAAVEAVLTTARGQGISSVPLGVPYPFHTAACGPAAEVFRHTLERTDFRAPRRRVLSSVLGGPLTADTSLPDLLTDQISNPVLFVEAAGGLASADLVIEVGPGHTLGPLVKQCHPGLTVVSLDTDAESLQPFLTTVAAAYAAGARVNFEPLRRGRGGRPIDLDTPSLFLTNPIEAAPAISQTPAPTSSTTGSRTLNRSETGQGERVSIETHEPASTETVESTVGDEGTLDTLRRLLADRMELPVDSIEGHTRPLDDLHMSSITIGQVVNEALRHLGKTPTGGVPAYATSTVAEIADLLEHIGAAGEESTEPLAPAGIGPWVGMFVEEHVERPLLSIDDKSNDTPNEWVVIGQDADWVQKVTDRLSAAGSGKGVCIAVHGLDAAQLPATFTSAVASLKLQLGTAPLVVLDTAKMGAAAFAKSVYLEGLSGTLTEVTLPDSPAAVLDDVLDSIAGDVIGNNGYLHTRYLDASSRHESRFVPWPVTADGLNPVRGEQPVILATGGAKGITAECAIALAQTTDGALLLLGRSSADDPAVQATLSRLKNLGIQHYYGTADVRDAAQTREAVSNGEKVLGSVTAILHGAGVNRPTRAFDLAADDFTDAIEPKLNGLRNVVEAVDQDALTAVVGFGSIIGRAGLQGEAHYATANAWLADELSDVAERLPSCTVLCLEWSVWTGTGMGESLGAVEGLRAAGIDPIDADAGVATFLSALSTPELPVRVVVCGRTGRLSTFPLEVPPLPLLRFLDRPRVHYPEHELVVDTDLSVDTDPYLLDHNLEGQLLFPAVMGLEAMTQAAGVLMPTRTGVMLTDVRFEHPIVVPADKPAGIRVVARRTGNRVDVVIRTAETGFAVDHFSATVSDGVLDAATPSPAHALEAIGVDPQRTLYGTHFFQGRRFQSLSAYRSIQARSIAAQLTAKHGKDWFAPYMPDQLLLADPDVRDGLMHALQACVPDGVLLPMGVDQIIAATTSTAPSSSYALDAVERAHVGDVYTYDLTAFDENGDAVEQWRGLRLRAVNRRAPNTFEWADPFVGPYLERRWEAETGGSMAVAVEPHSDDPVDRRAATRSAFSRLRPDDALHYRADGRPQTTHGAWVSSAHDVVTMTLVSSNSAACDVESVVERGADSWADLLGPNLALATLVADQANESLDVAGTRVWGALECIRKVGIMHGEPTLVRVDDDGGVVLAHNDQTIVTSCLRLKGTTPQVVFSVLGGRS